jgi:hypothetical protein
MRLCSRRKGQRVELAIAKALQANGLAAVKVSRAYQSGHDIVLPIAAAIFASRSRLGLDGFREPYSWLDGSDVLIVKADRREPLVILRSRWRRRSPKPTAGRSEESN